LSAGAGYFVVLHGRPATSLFGISHPRTRGPRRPTDRHFRPPTIGTSPVAAQRRTALWPTGLTCSRSTAPRPLPSPPPSPPRCACWASACCAWPATAGARTAGVCPPPRRELRSRPGPALALVVAAAPCPRDGRSPPAAPWGSPGAVGVR
jgi:hypothetical protein